MDADKKLPFEVVDLDMTNVYTEDDLPEEFLKLVDEKIEGISQETRRDISEDDFLFRCIEHRPENVSGEIYTRTPSDLGERLTGVDQSVIFCGKRSDLGGEDKTRDPLDYISGADKKSEIVVYDASYLELHSGIDGMANDCMYVFRENRNALEAVLFSVVVDSNLIGAPNEDDELF